jgi:predicted DNA-binding protein
MKQDKQPQNVQTAVRLPTSLLDRFDKLAERMSKRGPPTTRTAVLRLAATKGLEKLETEWKGK